MQRRKVLMGLSCLAGASAWAALPLPPPPSSGKPAAISEVDAASGIRAALERGAAAAVTALGRPNGYLANPKVRIPLPVYLESAARVLKLTGQHYRVDELVMAMNHAAESAVPEAKYLLVDAVRAMTVEDGRRILTGGEDSVTRFFASKTRTSLSARFLPIVTRATERVALADKYDAIAGKAAGVGLIRKDDANLRHYVTEKALDGLYLMIGEEEKKIRRDPLGTGSSVLQKVFGSLH